MGAPERTIMHRFTLLAGIALLCPPADSAPKPKPPMISVCYSGVCLHGLHWGRPEEGAYSLPSIAGMLVNNSNATLSNVSLSFTLLSGEIIVDTASDGFTERIPPGGRWAFHAYFVAWQGGAAITRIESGMMRGFMDTLIVSRRFEQPLSFDPVFNPINRKERKQWESIHGKRDQ
jgi:hypothetical protein